MLCYAMLCYAMLCLLCYAMLCYAMLCYAILYYTIPRPSSAVRPTGPAMAVPLFLPEIVLAEPHFWTNIFLQGHFLKFPSIPLLMTDFAVIKD